MRPDGHEQVRDRRLTDAGAVQQHLRPRSGIHADGHFRRIDPNGRRLAGNDVDSPRFLVPEAAVREHDVVAAGRHHDSSRAARADHIAALDHLDVERRGYRKPPADGTRDLGSENMTAVVLPAVTVTVCSAEPASLVAVTRCSRGARSDTMTGEIPRGLSIDGHARARRIGQDGHPAGNRGRLGGLHLEVVGDFGPGRDRQGHHALVAPVPDSDCVSAGRERQFQRRRTAWLSIDEDIRIRRSRVDRQGPRPRLLRRDRQNGKPPNREHTEACQADERADDENRSEESTWWRLGERGRFRCRWSRSRFTRKRQEGIGVRVRDAVPGPVRPGQTEETLKRPAFGRLSSGDHGLRNRSPGFTRRTLR